MTDDVALTTARVEYAPDWLRWITRVSIVFGIIGIGVTAWLVGAGTILDHLRAIGPWFLALLACEALATGLDSYAVFLLTRGPGAPSYREVVVAQFAGRAVNSVTPASNLGEALKVSLLARSCEPARVTAAVLYAVLTAVTISLSLIAIGTFATALVFSIPTVVQFALCAAALVSACLAATVLVLVRHGMLTTLSGVLARLGLISGARQQRWNERFAELDSRLRGDLGREHGRGAVVAIAASQLIQKALTYVTVLAAGYELAPGQFLALASAGVALGWVATIIPMGLGISEGGNVALFALIGAPVAVGVALALARRVNQVVFALLGFSILAVDRVASRVHDQLRTVAEARA